jgi:hypothetical protein
VSCLLTQGVKPRNAFHLCTNQTLADAFPQFRRKYGEQLSDGTYQIPAPWQAGLSNGANVGEIIGLFINGIVSERFGYRYTVMICLSLIIVFTAVFFTAQNVETLQVAEILCGIPWGVFQTLTITYASEVCPVALRGYLTSEFSRGTVPLPPKMVLQQANGSQRMSTSAGASDKWSGSASSNPCSIATINGHIEFPTPSSGCGPSRYWSGSGWRQNPPGGS